MMIFVLAGAVVLCGFRSGGAREVFPYTLQWKRLVGAPVEALAQRDSLVFVGQAEGAVLALRQRDGVRVWQRRAGGAVRRRLLVDRDALFFADTGGRVYAWEGESGRQRWSTQRVGWGDAELVLGDSLLYAGSADGWLYALRRADGSQAWRVRTGLRAPTRPWLQKGRLYLGTRKGALLAIDASSGVHLQRLELGARVVAGPVGVGKQLIVGCSDGYVRAYGRGELSPAWARRLGARLVAAPVAAGEVLVCAADNHWVYGLEAAGGARRWKRELQEGVAGAPVPGMEGEVLVATAAGRLLALDAGEGALHWEQELVPGETLRLHRAGEWLYASAGDGYLYAFAPRGREASRSGALWEDWWELFDYGHKSGYAHQVVLAESFGGVKALRLHEESTAWRSGFLRTFSDVWVDRAFAPLAFVERRIEESQVVETRGVWEGPVLRLERSLGGRVKRWEFGGEPGATLPEVVLLKLAREGRVHSGRRDSARVFDLEAGAVRTLYFSFGAEEEGGLEVRMRYGAVEPEDGLEEVEFLEWVDAQGHLLRSQTPDLGAGARRSGAEQARAWAPPGKGKQVFLDYAPADPARVERLVVELPASLGAARHLLVEDERQHIVADSGGRRLLVVQRVPYGGEGARQLPIDDARLAPFLASSLYIQAGDERIQKLARRLRGGERNAWKVARRLRQWVYDQMIPKDTNVRFKSTLEVLEDMEGTCSEYAVLFMALCRAAGLPARACVGFVAAQSGELVLHIWAQVYVGRWVDVDASWEGEVLDAAHIKTGQGLLTPAGMRRLNMPLQLLLARADTLKLVEYESDGKRFSARAERLFAEAEEAERHFADERACELYHQIALLPWNHRSGAALVDIGRYLLRRERLEEVAWPLERILHLDPQGEYRDEALFYLARLERKRGDDQAAVKRLREVVDTCPGSDMADDALGELAELVEHAEGCRRARPLYERLREEYNHSGWAVAAQAALERCRRQQAQAAASESMD